MTTEDFIIPLFCRVDNARPNAQKHSQASLFALKGVGYGWNGAATGRPKCSIAGSVGARRDFSRTIASSWPTVPLPMIKIA
jgi:hypothetical protein